jgi:tetratricopeptide (TPR) repeat protein
MIIVLHFHASRSFGYVVPIALAGLLVVGVVGVRAHGADPVPAEQDRGIARDAAPSGIDYTRKWAVVVGCNYADNPNPRSVPPLRSAEADAQAVYDELVRNYGYEADRTCYLLLGSANEKAQATHDRILDTLKDVVGRCNAESGTTAEPPKHSLLFFFAGHGIGFRSGKAALGKLYPADVTVEVAGSEPIMGNTLFMPEIVEYVDHCRAFHKLIILDCCESGLLFEEFKLESSDSAERSAGGGASRTDFSAPAMVGLTAGTQTERVKDSTDLVPGHSPFTGALLRGLGSALGEPEAGPFAVTELYVDITRQLERFNDGGPQSAITQRPQIGRLPAGMAGDFFFIPRAGFSPASTAREASAATLAGLGGLTGASWMEQWPWFTPAIRLALADVDRSLTREGSSLESRLQERLGLTSTAVLVDAPPDALMRSLHELLEEYRLAEQVDDTTWDDFAVLSDTSLDSHDRNALLADVRARIDAGASAPDRYLAALLEARLGRPADAEQHFNDALSLLAAEPSAQALLAVCQLDFAQFLFGAGRWKDCVTACERARNAAGTAAGSEYLQIESAAVQAAAYRKRGRFRDAEDLFSGPITDATNRIVSRGVSLHPTLATVAERHAWSFMDQWRLTEAAKEFEHSVELRMLLGKQADPGAALVHQLKELHSRHGLAMIAHFTSASDAEGPAAERMYADIADRCEDLLPRPALEEVLILERAVNSLERLADSMLLIPGRAGRRPGRAAAVLAQAVRRERAREETSGTDAASSPLPRLQLKRAIALLLAGETEAASRERQAADELLRAPSAPPPERTTSLLVAIADMLGGDADARKEFLQTATLFAQPTEHGIPAVVREEVDVALFGLAIAAERSAHEGTADDATKPLIRLLDTFNELGDSRQPLLRYLRRYRDVIVDTLASRAGDADAIDVADAIVASRGDDRFADADETDAIVLLHVFADDGTWLAVAQPAESAPGGSTARMVRGEAQLPATPAPTNRPPVPPELLRLVEGLAAPGGSSVIDWSDPVLRLRNEDFPFALPATWSLADSVPAGVTP